MTTSTSLLPIVSIALVALACADESRAPMTSAVPDAQVARRASPPTVGEIAPDFTLSDQNGNGVTLSAARGDKVVLVFYRGHW